MNNLETDCSDGVILINLLEILSEKTCNEKWHKECKMQVQKIENVQFFLNFLNTFAKVNVNPPGMSLISKYVVP